MENEYEGWIEYEGWMPIVARNAKKHSPIEDSLQLRLLKAHSFDEYKVIFKASKVGSVLKQQAFEGMAVCAFVFEFEHWHYMKKKAKKGSEFEKFSLVIMKGSAKTFDDRVDIYEASEPNSSEQNDAFKDLLATADSFPQWQEIFYKSSYCMYETYSGDSNRQFILNKMSVIAKNVTQYKFVHKVSQPGSEIRRDMRRKIYGMKGEADESVVTENEKSQTKNAGSV